MLNKNFANIGLVATANPSGTSHGAKPSEEHCSTEEQMQYIDPPDHEEEAVNYVNPQWGDNNNPRSGAFYPEPKENRELPNSGSSTSRSPKKKKMKRSTSGKGIEAEPENKKSSAPGATKELDIPDTELPRPELVSTPGRRNIVPTKVKDKNTPREEVFNKAKSVEGDSILTSKEESCYDYDLRRTAPVVIYNQEAVREIQNNQDGDIHERGLEPE
ncbi:hypothetical protein Dimus_020975 [Dionaea muscipula]